MTPCDWCPFAGCGGCTFQGGAEHTQTTLDLDVEEGR